MKFYLLLAFVACVSPFSIQSPLFANGVISADDVLIHAEKVADSAAGGSKSGTQSGTRVAGVESPEFKVRVWERPLPSVRRCSHRIVAELISLRSEVRGLESDLKIENPKIRADALALRIGNLDMKRLENNYNRDLMKKIVSAKNARLSPEQLALFSIAIEQSGRLDGIVNGCIKKYSTVKQESRFSPSKEDEVLLG